jgi:tRNA U34 5-carboxymethylaminomethyl modifying enzyme MnmG/GidA
MLLEDKNAVIYGGGGAIGGAVARAFAREGARVFLAGRTLATLDQVAGEIAAAGGAAETAEVDALDDRAVDEHARQVASAGAQRRRHSTRSGHAVRKAVVRRLRDADHRVHPHELPHGEGRGAAHGEARLRCPPHAVDAWIPHGR